MIPERHANVVALRGQILNDGKKVLITRDQDKLGGCSVHFGKVFSNFVSDSNIDLSLFAVAALVRFDFKAFALDHLPEAVGQRRRAPKYTADVHVTRFHVHRLEAAGRNATVSGRFRLCHIVAGAYTLVLSKHWKDFSLEDSRAVVAPRIATF